MRVKRKEQNKRYEEIITHPQTPKA